MANAWTGGWTARPNWPVKWPPGRGSGTPLRPVSIGPSPWPPHGGSSATSTRQSKIDDILVPLDLEGDVVLPACDLDLEVGRLHLRIARGDDERRRGAAFQDRRQEAGLVRPLLAALDDLAAP